MNRLRSLFPAWQLRRKLPPLVVAQLPRAGLGNKLLVWARAYAFAGYNGLPLWTTNWSQVKVGPILRGESRRRFYVGYFTRPTLTEAVACHIGGRLLDTIDEPAIARRDPPAQNGQVFRFCTIPSLAEWFAPLRDSRTRIQSGICAMLHPRLRADLDAATPPAVGVHVRMGDFRPLRPGEMYGPQGHIRVPLDYFLRIIDGIRSVAGCDVPVTVFSDGLDDELTGLLSLPNVQRVVPRADIVELLLLSRSKVLITSATSSFSHWSSFLSDAVVVHHPAHFVAPTRPERINSCRFEGALEGAPETWPREVTDQIRGALEGQVSGPSARPGP